MTRPGALLALAAVALLTTGCDPAALPEDADTAELYVTFDAQGGVDVDLLLGGPAESSGDLVAVGEAVAPVLLPGSLEWSVSVDDDGGGPFVQMHADHAYRPGPHPVLKVDTAAALSVLDGLGYSSVDVDISAPFVPGTSTWQVEPVTVGEHFWTWGAVDADDVAPAGQITLDPQPWRGFLQCGLTVVASSCLAWSGMALFGRRRYWRVRAAAGSVVSVAAGGVMVLAAGAVQGDNIGVAGVASGVLLTVLTYLPLLGFLAALTAAVVLVVAIAGGTRPEAAPPGGHRPGEWPPQTAWQTGHQ